MCERPLKIQVITHIIAPREDRAVFCRDASSCVTMDTRPRLSCVICGECLASWSDGWCRGLLRPRKSECECDCVIIQTSDWKEWILCNNSHDIISDESLSLYTYMYRHTLYLSLTCCMRTCPPVDHAGVWKDAQNHHLPPLEEDAGPDSCGINHDYQNSRHDRERERGEREERRERESRERERRERESRERERERERVCVERERERERESVWERERERGRERVWERESVWERERDREWERYWSFYQSINRSVLLFIQVFFSIYLSI